MKKFIGLAMAGAAALMLLAPFTQTATAAEFIAPDKDSGNLTLSSGDKHHNAYVAGGNVFINSDVTGDLYAAGGTIIVEGNVEQDIVVAGGTVHINGKVGGDVRVAGGTVIVNNNVFGDVIVAGGTVQISDRAAIMRDLIVSAGDFDLSGPVNGKTRIVAGKVTVYNDLGNDVNIQADELILGNGSRAGKITYRGIKEAVIEENSHVDRSVIDFQKQQPRRGGSAGRAFAAIFTMVFVIKVIGLVLAGLLLMKLFPRTAKNAVAKISDKPWVNLGIGVLALIVAPIVGLIVLITFVGFYIAVIAFLVYGMLLIFASLATCVFVGSWLVKQLTKRTEMVVDWQALLIGTVVVGVVSLIPFVGMLAVFVTVLMAFGGLIRLVAGHSKAEQN